VRDNLSATAAFVAQGIDVRLDSSIRGHRLALLVGPGLSDEVGAYVCADMITGEMADKEKSPQSEKPGSLHEVPQLVTAPDSRPTSSLSPEWSAIDYVNTCRPTSVGKPV
jgi:hypothetical protein